MSNFKTKTFQIRVNKIPFQSNLQTVPYHIEPSLVWFKTQSRLCTLLMYFSFQNSR